jgi:hypothetical protein
VLLEASSARSRKAGTDLWPAAADKAGTFQHRW